MCDLADAAMGMAYATTFDEGASFTTVEIKVNFLRPVRTERLTATGRVIKAGRCVGFLECAITDARGRLVATATSTYLQT